MQPFVAPSLDELQEIYQDQLARLEGLLTGSDEIVAANALLREMLGEVRLWGDPEARDGMRIEIQGDLSSAFQGATETPESGPWADLLSFCQISLVAGAGFEPATFRL